MTGYTLLEKRFISEVGAEGSIYTHDKTGARVIHLACSDPNKCFMISFPTIPQDSTGVAHIIEHSVLAGSEKYPLRDPFFELVKGSLNTFLNAFTGADSTMYPFASTNEKDFMNLLDVYLDAVFHPTLYTKEEIFRQEGWHYEINDGGELIINGIVYNEMRGAMSSPDRVVGQKLLAMQFDNCYQYNSGGDPEVIPTLTHEALCEFHRKHYHPSNAVIFLYGDIDAEKVLTFINENYLSGFTRQEPVAPIVPTKAFSEPARAVDYYPVTTEEEEADAAIFAESYVCCGAEDVLTSTALSVLVAALFDTEASPVRRALLESGLCSDVEADFDGTSMQTMLMLDVKGTSAENHAEIERLIAETLADVCRKGIDKELLTGCLNVREFYLREEHDGLPRGLLLGLTMNTDAFFGDDYFASVSYDATLKELRERISTDYYERLLEKYIISNTHSAILSLLPKAGLAQERDRALAERLAAYKTSLTDEEIEKIRNDAETLKRHQTEPEPPELLAKIPLLSLEDVGEASARCEAENCTFAGLNGLRIDTQTNGICYLNLLFDAGCLADEDLHYAGLLCEIFGRINTSEHGFTDLSKLALLHTGGIDLSVSAMTKQEQPEVIVKTARLSVKALTSELEPAIKLISELLTKTEFTGKAHLRELLSATVVQNRSELMYAGHLTAINRLNSYCTPAGYICEQISGLAQMKWLETALVRFDEVSDSIIAGLQRVYEKLFCRANLTAAVTGGDNEFDTAEKFLSVLAEALPEGRKYYVENSFTFNPLNEGIASASDSQYVAQGFNFKALGYEYNGHFDVLRTILGTDYLTQRVRIVGGAYGCFALIRSGGMFQFCSYRDPNLAATFDVFASVPEFLRGFDASDRDMLKFILGTLSGTDAPEAPAAAAKRAVADWLSGTTQAMRLKWRSEIIGTTARDIRAFADLTEKILAKDCRCVFGGAEKINSEGTMLKTIINTGADTFTISEK